MLLQRECSTSARMASGGSSSSFVLGSIDGLMRELQEHYVFCAFLQNSAAFQSYVYKYIFRNCLNADSRALGTILCCAPEHI